jgi:hypothetical protein
MPSPPTPANAAANAASVAAADTPDDAPEGAEEAAEKGANTPAEDGANANNNPAAAHHIRQTIAGPICTRCKGRRVNKYSLFVCAEKTLRRHWKDNGCASTGTSATAVEKTMTTDIAALHGRAARQKEEAFRDFDGDAVEAYRSWYCSRCGYAAKEANVERHCRGSGKGECRPEDKEQGEVLLNAAGFAMPKRMLQRIANGDSPLNGLGIPVDGELALEVEEVDKQSARPANAFNAANEAIPSFKSLVLMPSLEEIDKTLAATPSALPTNEHEGAVASLMELDPRFYSYNMDTFLHLSKPGADLVSIVTQMAKQQQKAYSPREDSHVLELLHLSLERWIRSGAANYDVKRTSAHDRAAVYKVGRGGEEEEDIGTCNTFTPTSDFKGLTEEGKLLLSFLYRSGWNKMPAFAARCLRVFDGIDNALTDEGARRDRAAELIANTAIVPNVILTALLEEPKDADAGSAMMDHLAARSVRLGPNDAIAMRSGNGISRGVNALLRLTRHAALSHCRRTAMLNQWTHEYLQRYREKLIEDVKTCESTAAICARIRSAREIDRRTPTKLTKMTDPHTGEVIINNVSIPRSKWSKTIPTVNAIADEALDVLLPAMAATEQLFDVANPLVLDTAGDASHVIVKGENGVEQKLHLTQFKPTYNNADAGKCYCLGALYLCYQSKTNTCCAISQLTLILCRKSD